MIPSPSHRSSPSSPAPGFHNMAQPHTPLDDWLMVEDPSSSSDENSEAEAHSPTRPSVHAIVYESLREYTARQQQASATPEYEKLGIPRDLYDKAQNHQDQLTDDERSLLLSRGDAIGKALGHPDPFALTTAEVHEVMQWPAPDVVRANVERATGGRMATPKELYEKAKGAIDDGRPLEAALDGEELRLLAQGFRASGNMGFASGAEVAALSKPGASQAMALVAKRMGCDVSVFHAAAMCHARGMTVPFPTSSMVSLAGISLPAVPLGFRQPGNPIAERGPVFSIPVRGQKDVFLNGQMEVEGPAGTSVQLGGNIQQDGPPQKPATVTSLDIFRGDLRGSPDFDEVLQRWDRLDTEEQAGYETKARSANARAETTFQQDRVEWLDKMRSK
ncbi:hypothetical protein B0T16DRAFT_423262 [Cercophora newfieldiana]|uniref:Uncharacterized protein n=1 Tax=Cercophora newfieldiana TaxID=92897 RepID=A0AA39XSU2_9PEZI|nr:hypothetical protein B0T16DRAFT_423262 [Cercophora newfieldiana]